MGGSENSENIDYGKALAEYVGVDSYFEAREQGESVFKASVEAVFQFFLPATYYTQKAIRDGSDNHEKIKQYATVFDVFSNITAFAQTVITGPAGIVTGLIIRGMYNRMARSAFEYKPNEVISD